jgi:hypothetical protein
MEIQWKYNGNTLFNASGVFINEEKEKNESVRKRVELLKKLRSRSGIRG